MADILRSMCTKNYRNWIILGWVIQKWKGWHFLNHTVYKFVSVYVFCFWLTYSFDLDSLRLVPCLTCHCPLVGKLVAVIEVFIALGSGIYFLFIHTNLSVKIYLVPWFPFCISHVSIGAAILTVDVTLGFEEHTQTWSDKIQSLWWSQLCSHCCRFRACYVVWLHLILAFLTVTF